MTDEQKQRKAINARRYNQSEKGQERSRRWRRENPERIREYSRKQHATPEHKAYMKEYMKTYYPRYLRTPMGMEKLHRYKQSPKGQENMRRYNHSPGYAERRRAYQTSPNGCETRHQYYERQQDLLDD